MKYIKLLFALFFILSIENGSPLEKKETLSEINKFSHLLNIIAEKETDPMVMEFLNSPVNFPGLKPIKCRTYIATIATLIKTELNWTAYFSGIKFYYNKDEILVIMEGVHGSAKFNGSRDELVKIIFPLKFRYTIFKNQQGENRIKITYIPGLDKSNFFYKYSLDYDKHEKLFKNKDIEKTLKTYLIKLFSEKKQKSINH